MINPLSVATDGYLTTNKRLLSIAVNGYLSYSQIPTPEVVVTQKRGDDAVFNVRLKRILQEDEEILIIIKSFIECQGSVLRN